MVLKPDKRQRIVVVNKKDYYDSLDQLFDDPINIPIFQNGPNHRLSSTDFRLIRAKLWKVVVTCKNICFLTSGPFFSKCTYLRS